LNSTIKNCY